MVATNVPLDGPTDAVRRELAKDLAKAGGAFATAQQEASSGRFDRAIEDYRSAWDAAVKALPKDHEGSTGKRKD